MLVLDAIKAYAGTDRIALINREETLSFSRLEACSEAFAAWLLEQYGEDRSPVVLYGHKETALLPCIFGALKAGRAYVPVDVAVPPERLAEIVADVAPKVLVDFTGSLPRGKMPLLDRQAAEAILERTPAAGVPREIWVQGEMPAYILFTSGSTGRPKGVPINADNLANFCRGLLPHMEGEGVVLNQISYSFDVSGCSLYGGLSRGMTLFTVDQGMVEDMGSLFAYLEASGLNVWVSTPSFAELCVRSPSFTSELLPGLRQFLFCGEVLTHKLCDQLAERFPAAGVVNTYGPTEATVLVTAAEITAAMRGDARSIPIGYPLDEVELRLVNDAGEMIAGEEEWGELLIISDSVGPGYHLRPDLTAQRFFVDEQTGKRGYRTGDICYRKDGLYYYTGRVDNQLKLGGYRIEIEDIEQNLAKLPNVTRAAVLPVWEEDKVRSLAAFVLLEQEDGLTALGRSVQIKRQAAALLPSYMIPRRIVAVDAFPLNTNGKIDKKELAKRLDKAEKG